MSIRRDIKRVRKLLTEVRDLVARLRVDPFDNELRAFETEDDIRRSLEPALVMAVTALNSLSEDLAASR